MIKSKTIALMIFNSIIIDLMSIELITSLIEKLTKLLIELFVAFEKFVVD